MKNGSQKHSTAEGLQTRCRLVQLSWGFGGTVNPIASTRESSGERPGCKAPANFRFSLVQTLKKLDLLFSPQNTIISFHNDAVSVKKKFKSRTQWEHRNHVFKTGINASCGHFTLWRILKDTNKPAGPFGTMAWWSWYSNKGQTQY